MTLGGPAASASLVIREARPSDRTHLLDLWVVAWAAAMPDIDFAVRRSWLDGHLDVLAASGATIAVACDDRGVAGFVTVDPATGALDQLAVAADRQGQGIAARLIEHAKTVSPHALTLSVNRDNPRALALYGKAGFTVTGTGANARSGLPIILMTWKPPSG